MTAPEPPAVPTGSSGPTGAPGASGPYLSAPGSLAGGPPPAGPPPATQQTQQTRPTRGRGRTVGRSLAAVLLVLVTVILVLFVVFNTQTVDISLVFGNVQAPLVLALVIAAALGGLVVALAGAAMRARRRKN